MDAAHAGGAGSWRNKDNTMARQSLKWFYDSAAWKSVRRTALLRDRYRCQICGGRATEVHHLTELSEKNVNDKHISLNLNNLQSLCHECHTRITQEEHGRCGDISVHYMFDADGRPVRAMSSGVAAVVTEHIGKVPSPVISDG